MNNNIKISGKLFVLVEEEEDKNLIVTLEVNDIDIWSWFNTHNGENITINLKTLENETKNHSQRKKDNDDAQNVALSGDTKIEQGKNIKEEHMPDSVDTHADTF